MALVGGGKKTIHFMVSNGTKDIGADPTWNPGRTGPKRRKSKGHKPKTGKAAHTKATHHYGSFAKGG